MSLWVWSRSLHFRLGFPLLGFCVLHFNRISEQGYLGVYSQSNLLDRMLRLHCYQSCSQENLTNIQYNPQDEYWEYWYWLGWYDFWRVKWGSLNYPFLGQQFMVGIIWPAREICTYNNFCIIIFFVSLCFVFCFCFLNFALDIYIMWFLRSDKTWLSECFSLLSRYELVLLEHFSFYFNVFIFLYI